MIKNKNPIDLELRSSLKISLNKHDVKQDTRDSAPGVKKRIAGEEAGVKPVVEVIERKLLSYVVVEELNGRSRKRQKDVWWKTKVGLEWTCHIFLLPQSPSLTILRFLSQKKLMASSCSPPAIRRSTIVVRSTSPTLETT